MAMDGMDGKVRRISVDGLRRSDPTVLSVMIQDIINKPIDKLSIPTLCDLVALSETDGLPKSLTRDLGRFRDKMVREYNDIPPGAVLTEHLGRLAELPPEQVPNNWREAVLARQGGSDLDNSSAGKLAELADVFEQVPAEEVSVADKPTMHVQHGPQKGPAANSGLQKRRVSVSDGPPKKRAASKGPAKPRASSKPVRDPARAEWIREDVLDRLSNYGSKGLKQMMLVIGARKRAPWNDLGQDEIIGVLKTLEKANRVRFSAGRWSMHGRGW